MDDEMAYSEINNGIKQEPTTHFHHELLQAQLSAEDSRNVDNNDSAEESGESPLDFSVKKSKNYDEISGSDSISSPASSLNDTGGHMEDRRSDVSDSSHNNSHSNGSLLHESPPDKSPLFHQKQIKNQQLQNRLSPVNDRIGQPRTADLDHSVVSLPNMLNDLQMNLANANALANSFPAMAALMDPRRLGGSKDTRPFKAYPKDLLSLSLGNSGIGLPHYLSSFANFENSIIMQGLNLSSEEIFSIYKQQLLGLRERDKYMETLKLSQHQSSIRTSTATTASPTTPAPLSLSSSHHVTKHSNNHHHGSITGNIPNGPSGSQPRTPSPHNGSSPLPAVPSSLTQSGRRRPRSLPDDMKDDAYWERRRKNNDAAKRSRDARRAKEDQIAIRAALLEQENLKLRVEVAALKTETAKLRCMLYNS